MKKTLLLLALIFGGQGYAIAQTDTTYNELADLEAVHSTLEPGRIATCVLLNQIAPFSNPHRFNGITDTVNNHDNWLQQYWEFYHATLNREQLPTIEYIREVVTSKLNQQQIPLLFINYAYNYLDPAAADNGLITIDSVARRVYDGPDMSKSPYLAGMVFAVSLPVLKTSGDFTVYVGPEFWFGNLAAPEALEIDFGDGRGYQAVAMGTTVNVAWQDEGEHVVKVRYESDALGPLTGQAAADKVAPLTVLPDVALGVKASRIFPGSPPDLNTTVQSPNTAIAWIKWGAGNTTGQFCKPLIFVEGIDFMQHRPTYINVPSSSWYCPNIPVGATAPIPLSTFQALNGRCGPDNFRNGEAGWNEMVAFNKEYKSLEKLPNVRAQLQQQGYDVVFFDFTDGADQIEENAMVLVEFLEYVNAHRAQNCGPLEDAVVIGASMGGQVSRFALSWMEQQNLCHNTKLWVSFDSPNRGANVPLGLQHMVDRRSSSLIAGNSFAGARENLLRPAAKQMLVYHFSSTATALRTAWQAWQDSPGSYPAGLRKVAIANGSRQAVTLPFNSGSLLIRSYNQTKTNIAIGRNWCYAMTGWQDPAFPNSTKKVYVTNTSYNNAPPNAHPYDNAPGCTRRTAGIFEDKNPGMFDTPNPLDTFMPTVSTLGVHAAGPIYSANLMYHIESNINRNFPDRTKYAFDAYYAPETQNEPHVQLTDGSTGKYRDGNLYTGSDNIGWLDKELQESVTGLPAALTGVYHFGSIYRRLLRSVTVNSGGQLLVNNGSLPVSGGTSATQGIPQSSNFELATSLCGAYVKVNGGGGFTAGDATYSGHTATVYFKRGSTLELNGGTLTVNNNSRIVIEEGATLIVNAGSVIELNGDNAVLEINGHLTIGPGATFTFTKSAAAASSGFVRYSLPGWRKITAAATSRIELRGAGQADKILELTAGAYFTANNWNMAGYVLENGKVAMGKDSKVYLFGPAVATNVHFEGSANLPYNTVEAYVTGEKITDCKFTNGLTGLTALLNPGDPFTVTGCTFNSNGKGLRTVNANTTLRNSSFNYNGTGWLADGAGTSDVYGSTFSHSVAGGILFNTSGGALSVVQSYFSENINQGVLFNGAGTLTGRCSNFTMNDVGMKLTNSAYLNLSKAAGFKPQMQFDNVRHNILFEDATGLNFQNGENRFLSDSSQCYTSIYDASSSAAISGTMHYDVYTPGTTHYNPNIEFYADRNHWNNDFSAPRAGGVVCAGYSDPNFDYRLPNPYMGPHPGPGHKHYFTIIDNYPLQGSAGTSCDINSNRSAYADTTGTQAAAMSNTRRRHSNSPKFTALENALQQAAALRKKHNPHGSDMVAFMLLQNILKTASPDTSMAMSDLLNDAYRMLTETYAAALLTDNTGSAAVKLQKMNEVTDQLLSWQQLTQDSAALYRTWMDKATQAYAAGHLTDARLSLNRALPLANARNVSYVTYWNCLVNAGLQLRDGLISTDQFLSQLETCQGSSALTRNGAAAPVKGKEELTAKQQEPVISMYPNPASGEVTLDLRLASESNLSVILLDAKGQPVRQLAAHKKVKSGKSGFTFNTQGLPTGLYLVRVTGNGVNQTLKLSVVK